MDTVKKNKIELSQLVWIATSSVIVIMSIVLLIYSHELTIWAKPSITKITIFTFLEILTAGCFVFAIVFGAKHLRNKKIIWLIIAAGIAARIILIPSAPILENDYNRYIWDGAVVAGGINPYKYSPLEVGNDSTSTNHEIAKLHNLSIEAKEIYSRINYPEIRTIYPMGSQMFFAASYLLSGWNILGWRLISFLIDIVTLLLLIAILKKMNLPKGLVAIYWLNPIVIHQFFNAGHMDILIFPFLLAAILFMLNNREKLSAVFLSFAIGVKLWPIILFPVIYRKYFKQKEKISALILITVIIVAVVYAPVFFSKLNSSLGFIKYAGNWYNNDAIFRIITIITESVISLFSTHAYCYHCIARYIVASIFLIILFFIIRKPYKNISDTLEKILIIVAVLFFLSPTEFPWYYTWMLPLLVIRPKISLILYTILLPLYQLQGIWANVVWFEHIPIIILFLYEIRNRENVKIFQLTSNTKYVTD